MNKFEKDCLKIRILRLASLKCTGTPSEMALKFEISERSIKRIIKEMRDEGNDIFFNHLQQSYVFEKK
jgi:biotin operon repressor